jgi:hypothetical protein
MDLSLIPSVELTVQPDEGLRESFLPTSAVKARYGGRSAQWFWSHERDGTFPAAVRINGRKYWRLADLLAYELNVGPRDPGNRPRNPPPANVNVGRSADTRALNPILPGFPRGIDHLRPSLFKNLQTSACPSCLLRFWRRIPARPLSSRVK